MGAKIQIGRLLLEGGILDAAQVEEVLVRQRREGGRFCSVALRAGLADERVLVGALSRQLGIPGMVVSEVRPDADGLDLVPPDVAEKRLVLPGRLFQRTLTLLMRDPADQQSINDLQFFSGKIIRPIVALEGPLREAVARCYGGGSIDSERTGEVQVQPGPVEVAPAEVPLPVVPVAALPPEQLLPVAEPSPADSVDPRLLAGLSQSTDGSLVEIEELASLAAEAIGRPLDLEPAGDDRPVILAVDDETAILKLYEGLLDPERYNVVTCERGDEALEAVRTHRPVLVLLDALLPGVHGFEICRRIKQHDVLGDTGVILLSAAYRGWQMKADLMRQYGADDFIEKPFDMGYLLEAVERIVEKNSGRVRGTRPLFAQALQHLNKGLVALQKGSLEESAGAFRQSIEADPFAARPHFYLGKIHERRGASFEAMYEYEQAVSLDAHFFPAIKDLAILYQSNGFVNKAVEMWQQALAACPEANMRAAIREHLVRLL